MIISSAAEESEDEDGLESISTHDSATQGLRQHTFCTVEATRDGGKYIRN